MPQSWERVEELLDRWEEAQRSARPLSPADLCADAPELLSEVQRRVGVMELVLRYDARPPHDSLADASLETRPHDGSATPPTLSPLRPGEVFNGFVLVALIGRGGMGEVWAADDTLRRRVAMKVLRPELTADPMALRRFAREALAHAAVQHENVVPIYSVGEHAGRPYLVLPLLEGESLSARLKREPVLPVAEVFRIGRELARGLAAAHARRLTHRDVKPGNIWLDSADGKAKLLDFGLARDSDGTVGGEPVTRSGAVIGTPAYMAPEQADGRGVDARADLFSLGVVLYQIATGVNPFAAPGLLQVMHALANLTPPPPSDRNPNLPPAFDALVLGLLEKDPNRRTPAAASDVADALTAIEHDDTASTRLFVPRRPARRRWVPAVVALGLALPLLVWGGWAVWPKPVAVPVVAPTPTPEERVLAAAAALREQPLDYTHTDETKNGVMGNPRKNQHAFRGTTGVPFCSVVKDGIATIKLPYSGRYDRESWEPLLPKNWQPVITESKTISGVVLLTLAVGPDGVRAADYAVTEVSGEVDDPGHLAHKTAKAAVLDLVRANLPER